MKKNIRFAVLSAITLVCTSCFYLNANSILGSGNIVSETRELPKFNSIQVSGSADLTIIKGETLSVTLSDYETLLPYWDLVVLDSTLQVKTKPSSTLINSRAKVTITLPTALYSIRMNGSGNVGIISAFSSLNKININGSGKVTGSQLADYKSLDIYIGGSGDVMLSGTAQRLTAKINGSGAIKLSQLSAIDAECNISGSGDIYIDVQKTLKASIYGSGNIIYTGSPVLDAHGSGSGKFIHH